MTYNEECEKWLESLGLTAKTAVDKPFRVYRDYVRGEDGWFFISAQPIGSVVYYARRSDIHSCEQDLNCRGLVMSPEKGEREGWYMPYCVLEPMFDTGPAELMIGVM